MKNGDLTYSKTPFKEKKHKRGTGGTFEKKHKTEEAAVSYHHKFTGKEHPRKQDGSFVSNDVHLYTSDGITYHESDALKNGKSRYGSNG